MDLRLASNLDAELQAHGEAVRSERRLTPTWFVDARYERVGVDGRMISQGILIVSAVRDGGYSKVFGVEEADSESDATYQELFRLL